MENMHPIFKGIIENFTKPPSKNARWQIESKICDGYGGHKWVNCWIGEDGKPETFESYEAVNNELNRYLKECHLAESDGDIKGHKDDNYRINTVNTPR